MRHGQEPEQRQPGRCSLRPTSQLQLHCRQLASWKFKPSGQHSDARSQALHMFASPSALTHLEHQRGAVADQVRQVGVHCQGGAQTAPLLCVEHAVRVQAHLRNRAE